MRSTVGRENDFGPTRPLSSDCNLVSVHTLAEEAEYAVMQSMPNFGLLANEGLVVSSFFFPFFFSFSFLFLFSFFVFFVFFHTYESMQAKRYKYLFVLRL